MKRFPKMELSYYSVRYDEESQEYKATATINLEGTISQVIEFEDYMKEVVDKMLHDESEVEEGEENV